MPEPNIEDLKTRLDDRKFLLEKTIQRIKQQLEAKDHLVSEIESLTRYINSHE